MEIPGYTPEQYTRPEVESRSPEKIKDELISIEKAVNNFLEVGEEIQKGLSGKDNDILNEVANNIFSNNLLSKEEKEIEIDKRIEKYEDNPEIGGLIKLFAAGYDLGDKQIELQNEYLPYKKTEIVKQVDNLSKKINFDRIINYAEASGDENIFKEVSYLGKISRETKNNFEGKDYEQLINDENKIKYLESKWAEKDFIGEENLEKPEIYNNEKNKNKIDKFIKQTENYKTLRSKYNFRLFNISDEKDNNQNIFLTNLKEMISEESEIDLRLSGAIEKYVNNLEIKLKTEGKLELNEEEKKNYYQNLIEKGKEDFGAMEIHGFGEKKNMELIMGKDELKNYLWNNVPIGFFEGMKMIDRRDKLDGEKGKTVEIMGKDASGKCSIIKSENGNYESWRVEDYEQIYAEKKIKNISKLNNKKNDLEGTVVHEMGHGNLLNNLTLEERQKWDEISVVYMKKLEINKYVMYARESDEDWGKREDFCESLRMFIQDPMKFKVLAKTRYEYMKDLCENRTENKEAFRRNLELAEKLQ